MMSIVNGSEEYEDNVTRNMNVTNTTLLDTNYTWNTYFEATILSVIFIVGLVGNILVIKTTVKTESRFARQIMALFSCLAMTDTCICLFRVGILMYIIFHPPWDEGSIVCIVWFMTMAIVSISIWENFLVVIQRLVIVKAFPLFRRYCTIPLMIGLVICIAIAQGLLHLCAFFVFHLQLRYDENGVICILQNNANYDSLFYRVIVLGALTAIPLILTITCHFWIVHRIIKAGLTRIEKEEDRDNFIKITKTALIRSFVLFVFCGPSLLTSIVDPYHDVITDTIARYFDYCICAHSALSPIITLQDSDFGDAMPRKSTKRKHSMSVFNSSFRRIGVSVITSENLKTNKNQE